MLARLIRIVNLVLAVLVVLIALVVYWFALRPLPKTSGELSAPVTQPAVVGRDALGVPHIEAASWQDAIFLQGFVTAQDRLWQMDSLRRFGGGQLSEVFGAAVLKVDLEIRRLRMRAIAENAVSHLRPADRELLDQYARGVNFYIDTHRGDYPLEFSIPGRAYDPRPWTPADSILIGLVMFQDLTDSSSFKFDKGLLLDAGADPTKIALLFPAMQGTYLSPGSNAWAVSGKHTLDGSPILANDPHLSYGIPGTWHLVHLKAPGLNASGAALPGVPAVITGHNQKIAWGVTNLQADVMDLYSEQIDLRTGRYVFKGQPQQAVLDRQTIRMSNHAPVEQDIWVTNHGPVILTSGGKNYALRWSAADGFSFPFFDLDRAANWEEFRTALHDFWGPGQNFVYADRAGHIGYQATGRVPIRRGFLGDVPLDGPSGNFEWDGYIPFEQLPSIYNPEPGIIATSNQDPFPPSFPYPVPGNFADRYRIHQVRSLLNAKSKLTVADMLAIQKDVYSAYDSFLARQIIAACSQRGCPDDSLQEAVRQLSGWNGQMDKNAAAPALTELLHTRLQLSLLQIAVTPALQRSVNAAHQPGASPVGQKIAYRSAPPNLPILLARPQVVQTLLEQRPAGWIPGNDWDAWLIANLKNALVDGRARQGSRISQWRWGGFLEWKIAHPIGKNLPLVDTFFDIGPVPMSGSGTTVKQTTATLGPSERMVADLGSWDKSVQNVPAGESGHVASPHYKDQWPAYYAGKSFPMQFEHVDEKNILRIKPSR